MIDVSIIFVNYKTKDLTINAINSVIEQTKDINYEIFLVDNNSQDGSIEEIEKAFPKINIIINDKNIGFGSANNQAIKQAKGKYILCLNTDTNLLNNAIKIMFDFMEENKNVGACGAYLTDKDGNPVNCGGLEPGIKFVLWKIGLRNIFKNYYEKKYMGKVTANDNIIKDLGYITGADIFFRKSVLDEVGIFDENIFMYFEETDLCKRIKSAGYDLKLVENAKIQHFEGKSTNNDINKKIWFKQSELYYFRKHHPFKLYIIKLIYIFLYLFEWLILRNNDSKQMVKVVING